jgi:dTDP-4-dehydrorhamnose reductase
MRILLFGRTGQVGWELQRALQPLGEVFALDSRSTPHAADFATPHLLEATVDAYRPDVIVNAAAYTAVDKAESEPELARAVNALAPAALARAAAARGAWLVHYGTDYVFDGSGETPWEEDAPTGPLSVYGRTKLEGEQAIRASGCRHLILRTSWVYAARGGNFAKTMLRLAAERDLLKVIDDQVGAPTGAELLADVTAHLLRTVMRAPREEAASYPGTYHVAASGFTTWHGYASFVIENARRRGRPVKVAADAVLPIPTSEYPTPARRPLNSRLDTSRLQQRFGLHLPHWQVGVERLLDEILAA